MKLVDLETFVVGNPPPRFGGRYFLFVKLTTDCGLVGYGEVYSATFSAKTQVVMIADVFERCFLNRDPHQIEAIWREAYGAGYSLRQGRQPADLQSAGGAGSRAAARLHLHLSDKR